MPTTFLSLPRELRDQIYEYILISPSTLIEPVLLRYPPRSKRTHSQHQHVHQNRNHSPSSSLSPQPRFALCTNPLSPLHRDPAHKTHTSLSLLRVCRLIAHESTPLFWSHNTFYFSTFHPNTHTHTHTPGLLKTLKLMGQIPSRLIQTITIRMSPLSSLYTTFSKCLLALSSRARHGSFRKLTVVWEGEVWGELVRGMLAGDVMGGGDERFWDELLDNLRTGCEECRYERVIEVPGGWDCEGAGGCEGRVKEITGRALHFAFGGQLFVGGVLTWEGYRRVGLMDDVNR